MNRIQRPAIRLPFLAHRLLAIDEGRWIIFSGYEPVSVATVRFQTSFRQFTIRSSPSEARRLVRTASTDARWSTVKVVI